ncbi:MAG: hypothetical protein JXA54_06460 [Candidatus Heimdallarchaeota archaeon]|nr:hypothetical protein [Candidatus Heimdallarchaeota archaeon]
MTDTTQVTNALNAYLLKHKIAIDHSSSPSIATLLAKCKGLPEFNLFLKELILRQLFSLNDLLYTTTILIQLSDSIDPKQYLMILNNTLTRQLQKDGEPEFTFRGHEVLIGEIVSVITSLTLSTENQGETVQSLLGQFQWYRDYLDPLGLVR